MVCLPFGVVELVDHPSEGARAIVVVSLQMTHPDDLRPSPQPPGARAELITEGASLMSRDLYARVGGPWSWVDRAGWSDEQWRAWTDREAHRLWVLRVGEDIAGYAELEQGEAGAVEIAYFGLLPGWAGRGLGGWLLTHALSEAWSLTGSQRVWVHTCELDSPAALANYRARGMREFARSVEWRMPRPDTVAP